MSDFDREKWDRKYGERGERHEEPCRFLASVAELLPRSGRALDVAGGAGRNALWLANRGLDVTIVDISTRGLVQAEAQARSRCLSLQAVAADLDDDPLPEGPWDLIVCTKFLHRPTYAAFSPLLAPGGLVVVSHPTRRNLERNSHPSARFLLEEGELPGLFPSLRLLVSTEGWVDDRHLARLAAVSPPA